MKEIMKEMVGGCCVCSDERGWPDNPLVYCDGNGCTVAVHQACYGIIAVPTGPWFCRKCESPETKGKVRCELCPSKSGALKRTDTGGWAHVVCALYIPEVRFGNVTSMEPIVLRLIPPERYNKICYICQDQGKTHRANAGACMQCNKSGCKQQFHVTCAQSLGLLCEEAGNYLDNVKYCGYCQHHYSKLKKGGNVKTIPPYKPVSHDSQSSDSSEREGAASPGGAAAGAATPTHAAKAKGPGRKSSHSGNASSGKNTPNSAKTPTNATQPMDKKKPSPSRRGSSAAEGGSSKNSTPAPSPQHCADAAQAQPAKAPGGSTPNSAAKAPPPAASPSARQPETATVISSLASATAASAPVSVMQTTSSSTSVVQTVPAKPVYQESVITNTDAMETKQTKKRKAVNASNLAMQQAEYKATTPPAAVSDTNVHSVNHSWEPPAHALNNNDPHLEDKIIKKAKTDGTEVPVAHFSCVSPAPPPPPPPAHSPAPLLPLPLPHRSPRHLPSPMPGPSGLNQMSNIRSPAQGKEREGPASLVVSVPLPPIGHGLNGLNLSASASALAPAPEIAPAQASAHPQIMLPQDMSGPSPHIFHQPHKQAAMEPSHSPHSLHSVPNRSAWGGLNVAYEMQEAKPSVSGLSGTSKDPNMGPMPSTMRNKKRAAMASASVVSMATPPPMQLSATQTLASVRRHPHQPTPPPLYQEIMKDSPPSSPSSERPLKPKLENNRLGGHCLGVGLAPHMLGNELNPESGAAARLQEQLSAELAAHAANSAAHDQLVPPPLVNKAGPVSREHYLASASTSSGRSTSSAQSLDQLLERQWEQGSQFLMEQAQHFDIASLLSCLHQLRTENVRLEEHVGNLLQRRDHLLAVNARLAIPLTAVVPGPGEPMRCPRDPMIPMRGPPVPVRNETITSERPQLIMREVQQKPS